MTHRSQAAYKPGLMRLCLVGLMIISISTIQTYLGPINSLRPGLLLFAGAVAALAYRPKAVKWSNLTRAWPVKAVFAMVVFAAGSTIFGISFYRSARFVLDALIIVLLPFFLTVIAIRNHRDLTFFIWGFVISVGILICLSLTVLEASPVGSSGFQRLGGVSTYDANDLGMIFSMALPLAILLYMNSGKTGRIVCGMIIALIPVAIALTGSRGSFLGLATVSVALFFTLDRIDVVKRIGVVAIVAGALVVSAPQGYWEQMGTITAVDEDYNFTSEGGRVALAKRGIGYMIRYPVFGIGVNNFGLAEGTISDRAIEAAGLYGIRRAAAHNTYVQVGAEMGLFALGVWLTLIVGGMISLVRLRRALRRSRDPEGRFLSETCRFLAVSLLAFAVTSFFLSHAYSTPAYTLLALMTGCISLSLRHIRSVTRESRGRGEGRSPRVRARRRMRAVESA